MMRKVAIVTGGARGIGFGISSALAADGMNLAILGTRPETAVTTALQPLRDAGNRVVYVQGSIAESQDRQRLIDTVDAEFGRLNLLVNNAGVAPKVRADILEATEESFDFVMTTNLKGPYFLTQLAAQYMVKQRQTAPEKTAGIINVSSISATVASPSRGEYCLSKAGVSMATRLWAVRLGEFGIPVYEIQPGVIRTDMTSTVTEKYDRLIADGLCVDSRWGTPEDIGRAVAMLARGDLPYATGQVLHLDGGMTLQRL